MHIAVTGGCGYLGSILLPKLIPLSEKIDLLDIDLPAPNLVKPIQSGKIQYLRMDVSDSQAFRRVASQYDVIVHLAGLVGYPICAKQPKLAVRTNVLTTKNILQYKKPSARVILSSTISCYGAHTGIVEENSALLPPSIYGKTKQRAEQIVLSEAHNLVFRLAGAFGASPKLRDDLLIHDFVKRAAFRTPTSIYESHFVRQFIHVNDITDAFVFAIQNWNRLKYNVYNVGNPAVEITKRQLAEAIAEKLPWEYRLEETGKDPEKRNYSVSFKRFLAEGFQPSTTLKKGLIELIQEYLRQSDFEQSPTPQNIQRQPEVKV